MKKWLSRLFKNRKWQNFFSRRKKKKGRYVLVSVLSVLIICLLYLAISMSRVSADRMNFLTLKNSFNNSYPCHETCLVERKGLRNEVINNWNKDEELQADWFKYFEESIFEENYNLQKELLMIATYVEGSDHLEQTLLDNLLNSSIDEKTKANIINIYLISLDDPNLSSYYLSLIENSKEDLQLAAIRAISSLSNKKRAFKIEDVTLISNLILYENMSSDIKLDLFFLLFDYETLFKEKVEKILVVMIENSDDEVIKYIATEHLIKLGNDELVLPEVTSQEWDTYFNF
ncbi:MAG TPA: hypothetical protein VFD51_01380 [Patescibacteria group bacterium]|nr:hypothetical protein [Patescibacteria group bacterium]